MFVSSYSTYLHTNSPDRIAKNKESRELDPSKSFTSKLSKTLLEQNSLVKNAPINYVLSSKSFANKEKLQQNIDSKKEIKNTNKFNTLNSMNNAKTAYSDNSRMFSLISKPQPSMDNMQKPYLNANEPNLKHKAINAYIANDRYFRITA